MLTEEIVEFGGKSALIQIFKFKDSVYCWVGSRPSEISSDSLHESAASFENLALSFGANASSCLYGDSFENSACSVAAKICKYFF